MLLCWKDSRSLWEGLQWLAVLEESPVQLSASRDEFPSASSPAEVFWRRSCFLPGASLSLCSCSAVASNRILSLSAWREDVGEKWMWKIDRCVSLKEKKCRVFTTFYQKAGLVVNPLSRSCQVLPGIACLCKYVFNWPCTSFPVRNKIVRSRFLFISAL